MTKVILTEQQYKKFISEDSILNQLEFQQESEGYHNGQSDLVWKAYLGDKIIGSLEYTVYEGTASVRMLSVNKNYRRQGIAAKLMEKLSDEFGYKNIDTGMMTIDGSALISTLDKLHSFDREAEANKSKHLSLSVLDRKNFNSKDVWQFMVDYYYHGNEVWSQIEKYNEHNNLINGNDPNDLTDIVRWIEGAKTN